MSGAPSQSSERLALAGALRDACVERLRQDFEQAAIQGLCGEGALEYALDRLRHMPTTDLLTAAHADLYPPSEKEEGNEP
jgi:hypothetical protein